MHLWMNNCNINNLLIFWGLCKSYGWFTSLTWLWWFDFRLKPIFATAPAPSNTCFKSGQKWLQNNHLTLFTKVQSKSFFLSILLYLYCRRNVVLKASDVTKRRLLSDVMLWGGSCQTFQVSTHWLLIILYIIIAEPPSRDIWYNLTF